MIVPVARAVIVGVVTMVVTVRLAVAVTTGVIVGVFRVRYRRIEHMTHLRTHVGFFRFSVVGITPATALQVKVRRRQQLFELRLGAFGTVAQWISTDFLQGVERVAATLALVVKDRH